MANNRMLLVCNVCNPKQEGHLISGGWIALAKWYPANYEGDTDGSYYTAMPPAYFHQQFFAFLEQHQHKDVASQHYKKGAGQPNPVRIEYESEDLPVIE